MEVGWSPTVRSGGSPLYSNRNTQLPQTQSIGHRHRAIDLTVVVHAVELGRHVIGIGTDDHRVDVVEGLQPSLGARNVGLGFDNQR